MWTTLLNSSPINKNTVILFLVTVNVIAIAFILISRDTVKREREAYAHPKVEKQVIVKTVEGPIRIVERIIERPGGEKETERTITKEPVTSTESNFSMTTPIAIAGSSNKSRYLLGGSYRLNFTQAKNGTVWAGYSFLNRIDVLGGLGIDRDRIQAHVMVLTRWG